MNCPKCDHDRIETVSTGNRRRDYLFACMACSWQVAADKLQDWLARWSPNA